MVHLEFVFFVNLFFIWYASVIVLSVVIHSCTSVAWILIKYQYQYLYTQCDSPGAARGQPKYSSGFSYTLLVLWITARASEYRVRNPSNSSSGSSSCMTAYHRTDAINNDRWANKLAQFWRRGRPRDAFRPLRTDASADVRPWTGGCRPGTHRKMRSAWHKFRRVTTSLGLGSTRYTCNRLPTYYHRLSSASDDEVFYAIQRRRLWVWPVISARYRMSLPRQLINLSESTVNALSE